MSAGKGKRVAPEGPLAATSSSSSDDDSPRRPAPSTSINSSSPASSLALSPPPPALQPGTPSASSGYCSSPCSVGSSGLLSHPYATGSGGEGYSPYSPREEAYPPQQRHHHGGVKEVRRPKNKKKKNGGGAESIDGEGEEGGVRARVGGAYEGRTMGEGGVSGFTGPYGVTEYRSSQPDEVSGGAGGVGGESSGGAGAPPARGGVGGVVGTTAAVGQRPTVSRAKAARGPMPMRQRALPPSFWQQPNVSHGVSPGSIYSILPPLFSKETLDIAEVRPVTPPDEREPCDTDRLTSRAGGGQDYFSEPPTSDRANPLAAPGGLGGFAGPQAPQLGGRRFSRGGAQQQPERTISIANSDLLLRLFDGVERDALKQGQLRSKARPRKFTPAGGAKSHASTGGVSSTLGGVASGLTGSSKYSAMLSGRQDPYLVECITDKLFPQLSLEGGGGVRGGAMGVGGGVYGGHSTVQLLSVRGEGDRVVALPALTSDQNYPAMLTELVAHI